MSEGPYKYRAFISYSHRDQAWAEWLHRALETYRVPRRLVGRDGPQGPLPRRLYPVFRDQEELASSPDLSSAIDEALRQSQFLILVASPYAAVSNWVDQEIVRFRALGRGDRILCLIVDGEPHADLQPGKGLLECFPPALRGAGVEPIGADLRPGKDGKAAARLKLVAGLLGIGLDELRRREQRRRLLQRLSWAGVGVFAAAALAGLWQVQQREKRAALEQQALYAHIEDAYQHGREELLGRNQARAAVYLAEAYRLGVDTPALRFMLARALRVVDAEAMAIPTGAPVDSLRFSPDRKSLYTYGGKTLRVWDTASGRERFHIEYPLLGKLAGPRFSRDNRLLYVYVVPRDTDTGKLVVWDARSGAPLGEFSGAPSTAHTLNPFSADGRRVVHVATDSGAEILELSSGRVLARLPGPFGVAGFSRDGRRLLTGAPDGVVSAWDALRLRPLRRFAPLPGPVTAIDDTEDGGVVAAASAAGAIRAWSLADGALRVFAGHPSPTPWLIFNLDGGRLFTGAGDGVRVWNTLNGNLVFALQFTGSSGNRFDISSDGRLLLASHSSRLAVQDLQSGLELYTLDGHRGVAAARDISEDDRAIATGGPDGRAIVWNTPALADFEYRHPVDLQRWPRSWRPGIGLAYSPDGKLLASGAADGRINLRDAATHLPLRELQGDAYSVNVLAFSRDGRLLLSGGESDGVKLWDAQSGELLRSFDCDGKEVLRTELSADGRHVLASVYQGATRVWDAHSGEVLASFDGAVARAPRFTPDGAAVLVGTAEGVGRWDFGRRAFAWTARLPEGGDQLGGLDVSADGATLVAAEQGSRAYVLDAADGRVLHRLDEPAAGSFQDVRFDGGGVRAVLAGRSGAAVLWNIGTGQDLVLRGHAGAVRSVRFSGDGRFVLSGGVDGTARIWDAANGEQLDLIGEQPDLMPDPPFVGALFSADDRHVLTGSVDGVVREWAMPLESRSPGQVDALLRCRVPWRLEGGELKPAAPDATSCPTP